MVGAIIGLLVPITIIVLIVIAVRGGKRMQARLEADFRGWAARLGLDARIGPGIDELTATGTARGVPLTIEVRRVASKGRNTSDKVEARVRGRTQLARPTTVVLRRADGPSPDGFPDLREIATSDASFDETFRTLVSDEEAARTLLDEPTRARVMAVAGFSHVDMRLALLRCSREEVAVTLDGLLMRDVAAIERAVELVIGMSLGAGYR